MIFQESSCSSVSLIQFTCHFLRLKQNTKMNNILWDGKVLNLAYEKNNLFDPQLHKINSSIDEDASIKARKKQDLVITKQ